MEAIKSLFSLRWRQEPTFRPLPEHVQRTFVKSPGGELELLVYPPKHPDPNAAVIFFTHGGYGSAGVWLEWMTYLHNSGYGGTLYAYSARNHGASYTLSYLRMVYGTPLDDIATDLRLCYDHARKQEIAALGEDRDLILVGHSSGGGLSQYALAQGLVKCKALCLVDAIPHFGAIPVYANWARHDPWFMLRMMLHLQHPTSPLSSDRLVHGAFFCKSYPRSAVGNFARYMPKYESLFWPMAMMGSYLDWWRGSPSWLNPRQILSSVTSVPGSKQEDRICVMVGSEDVLMDLDMARKQALEYRAAMRTTERPTKTSLASKPSGIDGTVVESEDSVRLVTVHGAGHHLQNDLQKDAGAETLLDFIQRV